MSQNVTKHHDSAADWSPLECEWLLAISAGESLTSIAERTGVARETLSRFRNRPATKAQLNRILGERWEESTQLAMKGHRKAIETVIVLMDSDDEKIQLGAASTLHRIVAEMIELNLHGRMQELELTMAQLKQEND
ncbi:MAG: hypothetical protein RIK87_13520 [Fuerstiella sp.]